MFALLGKTVSRFWLLFLGAWILLLGAGGQLAPAWDEITQGGDVTFLPDDTPSRRGEQLFKKAFPDGYSGSSVVLVISREEDETGLQEEDNKFIEQILTPALKRIAGKKGSEAAGAAAAPVIARIRAPEDQGVGAAPEPG